MIKYKNERREKDDGKQKMLMGILYNAEDQALIEERNHAKSLTRQFNEHWGR